ncbi:hypothetical protein HanPSC8_Chr04g0172201 [Helianthus annuus]|nr:hypothetical protein HanPSC8_Chr04g0172201 [Helianthus annuus]
MEFLQSGPIPKEDIKIPHKEGWYNKLMATPNRVFGEQVLVATGMSDKWPERSKDVPVLQFNGEEAMLYQSAFPTFSGTMSVRPLRDDEEYWYEQIKPNFMYARTKQFAAPPVATEGVHIPNPRLCRAMTPAGKEIVCLSSVLRDLEVEHEEKKPKKAAKKKVTIAGGAATKKAETAGMASDAASRKEAVAKKPKVEVKKAPSCPKIIIIPPKTTTVEGKAGEVEKTVEKDTVADKAGKKPIDITSEVTKTPEFAKVTGGEQPAVERVDPEVRGENPTAQHTGPVHTELIKTSTAGESAGGVHVEGVIKDIAAAGGDAGGSGADARKGAPGKKPRQPSPIRVEDTLGDIYYKTYGESRADEPQAPVWNLIQSDTLVKFGACRERMMGAFPPAEIVREWRTLHLERASWEKHRERLAAEAKLFEQVQIKLQEDRASFDKEKKSKEWGLQGLKKKLQASKDTLADERRKWRVACENENKKMFTARTKITNLEAQVEGLKKSEAEFKEKYEETKSHRERAEVDLNAQILSKDRDLAGKDAEIAELKRRLREEQEGLEAEQQKNESMEIDLAVRRLRLIPRRKRIRSAFLL